MVGGRARIGEGGPKTTPWGRSTATGGQLGVGSGWRPEASGVTPRLLGEGQRDVHHHPPSLPWSC